MRLTYEIKDGVVVLYLETKKYAGPPHSYWSGIVFDEVKKHLNKFKDFIIDLSGVEFLDEYGVGSLMAIHTLIENNDGRLILVVSTGGVVANKLKMMKIDDLLGAYDGSVDGAINFFKKPGPPILGDIIILTFSSKTVMHRKIADKIDILKVFSYVKSMQTLGQDSEIILRFGEVSEVTKNAIDSLVEINEFIEARNAIFMIVEPKSGFEKKTKLLIEKKFGRWKIYSGLHAINL